MSVYTSESLITGFSEPALSIMGGNSAEQFFICGGMPHLPVGMSQPYLFLAGKICKSPGNRYAAGNISGLISRMSVAGSGRVVAV